MTSRNQMFVPTLLLSVVLTGCTSLQTVHPETAIAAEALQEGDRLVVTLTDGQKLEHRLIDASADALVLGSSERSLRHDNPAPNENAVYTTIAWTDIEKLERREFSAVRTGGLVLLVMAELAALSTGMFVVP